MYESVCVLLLDCHSMWVILFLPGLNSGHQTQQQLPLSALSPQGIPICILGEKMLVILLMLRKNDIEYLFCKIFFLLLFFSDISHIVEKSNAWSIIVLYVVLTLKNRIFIKTVMVQHI